MYLFIFVIFWFLMLKYDKKKDTWGINNFITMMVEQFSVDGWFEIIIETRDVNFISVYAL